MTRKTNRISSIFWTEHIDYVHTFKEHFARRIRKEQEHILNLESLHQFIASRANNFRITEPRSMAMHEFPEQELQHLFRKIFDETAKPRKPSHPTFRTLLHNAIKGCSAMENRVIFKMPKVQIPGFSQTISPCLGFLNGRFNLVVCEHITAEKSFARISHNLFAGQKLFEQQGDIWGDQQLYLLVEAGDEVVREQIEENRLNFQKHNVAVYTSVGDMAHVVNTEAREISEDIRSRISQIQSA